MPGRGRLWLCEIEHLDALRQDLPKSKISLAALDLRVHINCQFNMPGLHRNLQMHARQRSLGPLCSVQVHKPCGSICGCQYSKCFYESHTGDSSAATFMAPSDASSDKSGADGLILSRCLVRRLSQLFVSAHNPNSLVKTES